MQLKYQNINLHLNIRQILQSDLQYISSTYFTGLNIKPVTLVM